MREHERSESDPMTSNLSQESLVAVREELRLLMLRQPATDERETYSDGFFSGLAHSISRIDSLLAVSPDQARPPLDGWAPMLDEAHEICRCSTPGYTHAPSIHTRNAVTAMSSRDELEQLLAETVRASAVAYPMLGELRDAILAADWVSPAEVRRREAAAYDAGVGARGEYQRDYDIFSAMGRRGERPMPPSNPYEDGAS